MDINNYFETYRELLNRLETDQLLSPFGISTEADKSEDVKKLNVLFEHKDEVKDKLLSLPGNSPYVAKMPIELKNITKRTDQIIRKSIEDRKEKAIAGDGENPLMFQLWTIRGFWTEANILLLPSTDYPEKDVAKNSGNLILNDEQKNLLEEILIISESVFEVSFPEFLEGIKKADLRGLKIKIKSKAMYLTYILSTLFGGDWYGYMCRNMGWKKSKCSGATISKDNPWKKQIDDFARKNPFFRIK